MAEEPGEQTPTDSYVDDNASGLRLISQEGVFQLTQDLRNFSDTLTSLKAVFCEEREYLDQSLRVVAHERLGELLKVLKSTVNKYEELDSTGILNAAENLINHIKNFNYECVKEVVPPEIFSAINNLALAFSSSVSECLIGDINISPRHSVEIPWVGSKINETVQPPQAIHKPNDGSQDIPINFEVGDYHLGGPEFLPEVHESVAKNLEIAFDRAKTWSKYGNDLLSYVKKKAHIELEYANKLAKLSQTTRAILSEQSYLPFQSLYCTALDNDKDFASNICAMYNNSLLAQKFLEPLQSVRQEHDRLRKTLRETWRKEKRRLEEAEANLRKAKQQYHTRNQEYQKAKEAAIKADQHQYASVDGSHSRQGSGTSNNQLSHNVATGSTLGIISSSISKIEKKRKQEDDSYYKAMQAEQYYRACVDETDQRRQDLEKKEDEILDQLRTMLTKCDQTTKGVTLNFFSAHCDLTSPIRVQYQALYDESRNYEPGFQYAEYLRHLVPHQSEARQDSQFQAYPTESEGFHDPVAGGSDTETSSNRSLDEFSPSASPINRMNRKVTSIRRASTEGSLSSDEILDEGKEITDHNRVKIQSSRDSGTQHAESSPATMRPQFPQMKKMVANVKEAFKGMKKLPKATVFGVDFSVAAQDSPDGIPMLVKRCVAEIDNRGLNVKGIYRVNGVKNRIEKLCTILDSPHSGRVDLSEQLPHDISGVLKYFLRQLPEPLIPYEFYDQFLQIAKESAERKKASKLSRQINDEEDGNYGLQRLEHSEQLQPILEKMKATVDMLPLANQKTLYYIMAHLSRVAQHHTDNKMTASNLAIIFGPNLLRPKPSDESGQELVPLLDLPSQSQALEILISHHRKIFLDSPHEVRYEATRCNSKESLQRMDSGDTGDTMSQDKTKPASNPSSDVLSFGSISPVTDTSHDIKSSLTSESHRQSARSSSGSSFVGNDDSSPARNESYSESPRMELSNDAACFTNDGRTVLPHRISLTKISSPEMPRGSAPLDTKYHIHRREYIIDESPVTIANINPPTDGRCRSVAKNQPVHKPSNETNKTYDNSSATLCGSEVINISRQPLYKMSQGVSLEPSTNVAVSARGPQSQQIIAFPPPSKEKARSFEEDEPPLTVVSEPSIASMASVSLQGKGLIYDPDVHSEDVPCRSARSNSATSPISTNSRLQGMPGRTPPINKSHLSIAKNGFSSIDNSSVKQYESGQGRRTSKMLLDVENSEDDSFC